MNLYKAHLVDIWFANSAWAVFRYPAFNFNCFKLFHSSSHILGPKYAKEFNP